MNFEQETWGRQRLIKTFRSAAGPTADTVAQNLASGRWRKFAGHGQGHRRRDD